VLDYCAGVATSPDPEDPDAVARKIEEAKASERVIDDRLDPYSSRYFPRDSRTQKLAVILQQERGVEKIVRSRTWGAVTERCAEGSEEWQLALDDWRKRSGKS
jgi:hypothetical protein